MKLELFPNLTAEELHLSSALCGYALGFPSFPCIHRPTYTTLYTCSGMKPLVFPKHDFRLKRCTYAHTCTCTEMHISVCTRTQTQHWASAVESVQKHQVRSVLLQSPNHGLGHICSWWISRYDFLSTWESNTECLFVFVENKLKRQVISPRKKSTCLFKDIPISSSC